MELKYIESGHSDQERLMSINPNFGTGAIEYIRNCGNCAVANELRHKGVVKMTLQEAYLKAKSDGAKRGETLLTSCNDYGEFWGFYFRPPTDNPDGIANITVNKETGAIGYFIPPMNLDLWRKRKPISIEQFAEYNVAI